MFPVCLQTPQYFMFFFCLQGKEGYLNIVKDYVKIHGTVYIENTESETIIPKYVHNHGIMKGPDLHRLLRESKVSSSSRSHSSIVRSFTEKVVSETMNE